MPEVTKNDLKRLYVDERRSLVELGALYSRAPGTVWGWLRSRGIPIRSCREAAKNRSSAVSDEDDARMREMYELGASSNDIAKEIGRDGRLIRIHLRGMGILRGRTEAVRLAAEQGKIYSSGSDVRFFEKMTPETAWVLGLMFGDGHVPGYGNNQMVLAGTESVCRSVADLLGHSIGPSKDQKSKCWLIKWSSWRTADFLRESYGMCGNKATTMSMPYIPSDLLHHFVRGAWDADGGWKRVGYYLRATYYCSSMSFVSGMVSIMDSMGWGTRVDDRVTDLNGKKFLGHRVVLSADHSRKLAEWLYRDTDPTIRCERKFNIALQRGGPKKFGSDPLHRGEESWL